MSSMLAEWTQETSNWINLCISPVQCSLCGLITFASEVAEWINADHLWLKWQWSNKDIATCCKSIISPSRRMKTCTSNLNREMKQQRCVSTVTRWGKLILSYFQYFYKEKSADQVLCMDRPYFPRHISVSLIVLSIICAKASDQISKQ